MNRFLTIAALVAGLCFITSSSEAGDYLHGGHGVHSGHRNSHGYGGYSRSPYSNFGYGGYYGGQPYGFSNGNGYQPLIRNGYAPSQRSYGHNQYGGLHVDVGRLHFGYGAHH